ncbi:hypothetical protein ACRE_059660 [Hapsidospora chrysogenum ATCC 11550]|uniref:Uncharacterized protein n=1 Tax=Hapsidospora chrysogenum (strain ATCC 11550 / CBS 779.69 / DSM 880 / IAM 14645 / JCM 23072 / IMI 49137) TaxID=857340 RepID=A0A086T1N5_HAPC1|nr:hypothetical protein ACRE_059660 [Hapsidospora chrysogenum ATCC 11550]
MSRDTTPFVPPQRYPSPPRNMWYEVPKEPPAPSGGQPKPMFPWESRQARPSRKFPEAAPEPPLPLGGPPTQRQGEPQPSDGPHAPPQPSPTVSTLEGSIAEPSTPSTPRIKIQPPVVEPWTSYQLVNAWDEVPQINRYVEGFQRHRRGKSADIASPLGVVTPVPGRRSRGFKLTDFPSATERPSLPVTPLPISRPSFWGEDKAESQGSEPPETLPAAEGVPAQSEWVCVHGRRWMPTDCMCELADALDPHQDPRVQLEKLARQHSEQLLRRLSGGDQGGAGEAQGRVIPKRSLPFGSENAKSPTYVAQAAVSEVAQPKPVKGRRPTTGSTLVGQSSAAPTGASTATRGDSRGDTRGSGSAKPTTQEGSSSSSSSSNQLLESPMPRLESEKAKGT